MFLQHFLQILAAILTAPTWVKK